MSFFCDQQSITGTLLFFTILALAQAYIGPRTLYFNFISVKKT